MTDTTTLPEDLALRSKPRPVRRFNRNALMGIVGAGALLVFGSLAMAFRDEVPTNADDQTELYNTTNRVLPPELSAMPTKYDEVASRRLGPPLPGDLGFAILGTNPEPPHENNQFRFQGSPKSTVTSPPQTAQPQATSADSPLFFIQNGAGGQPTQQQQSFNRQTGIGAQLAQLTLPAQSPALDTAQGIQDPNRQDRKAAFLGAEVDADIYNPHRIQTPVSPFQVMAGTIIPASLVTGLNSDLPGQVIAQVTENVYDTPSGAHLLIPQGTRLIGRYDSIIAFGQSRALVAWNRIIMPNGTSMTLENLPGADLSGAAGLNDRVDNHTFQIFQAAILSSILSIASEIGRNTNDSIFLDGIRDGGQRTINQAGQQVVQRQLDVQPTITVRPGHRLRVIVNKDLILQPYGG